jgi:hypothetical protein
MSIKSIPASYRIGILKIVSDWWTKNIGTSRLHIVEDRNWTLLRIVPSWLPVLSAAASGFGKPLQAICLLPLKVIHYRLMVFPLLLTGLITRRMFSNDLSKNSIIIAKGHSDLCALNSPLSVPTPRPLSGEKNDHRP